MEYCRNFVLRRHFPIHQIFERSCDSSLFRLTADTVARIFGVRVHKRLRGKLSCVLDKFDHGHHVMRVYCKSLVARLYEKVSNLHVDFPLFQRIALPIAVGHTRIPGIKIHDTRMIRLMEVLLHTGSQLHGWRTTDIRTALLTTFGLTPETYSLSQLRYDARKMKAHGLVERDGRRYCYRLTDKGIRVATLFVLFHKRVCGPLANTLFEQRPDKSSALHTPLETAY